MVVVPFEPLSFSLRGTARKWVSRNPVKYRKRVQMPRALDWQDEETIILAIV